MRLDIVSLFPGICSAALSQSIIGRAWSAGLVDINLVDLRDFSVDSRRSVDDSPYGGGAGMLLSPAPLFECLQSLSSEHAHIIFLCPQGQRFEQSHAQRLAKMEHLILVAGHYEGIDERARQCLMHEEFSLGDYVLTNGAIAAAVLADSVLRLLPGVLGSAESADEESFGEAGLLEYAQYTRPAQFAGMQVPETLLGGNHADIAVWRRQQSLLRSISRRPDLFENNVLSYIRDGDTSHERY